MNKPCILKNEHNHLFNGKRFIIYISCFTDYNFFLISEKILKLGFLFPAIISNSGKNIFVLVVFFNKERGPAISVDVNQCFPQVSMEFHQITLALTDLRRMWQCPLKKKKKMIT